MVSVNVLMNLSDDRAECERYDDTTCVESELDHRYCKQLNVYLKKQDSDFEEGMNCFCLQLQAKNALMLA